MKVIRQSVASYLWGAFAASGLIHLQTFGGVFWFPAVTILSIGITGVVMSLTAERFLPHDEIAEEEAEPIEETPGNAPLIAVGAMVALVGFMVLSWVLKPIQFVPGQVTYTAFFSQVTLPTQTFSQVEGSFVFLAVMVPWGEEEFFRGFIGNLALHLPPGVAEIFGGTIFMAFHAAVYSLFAPVNPYLIAFLSVSGAIFIAVDLYTEDITTSLIAHSANNGLTFLVGGSVIGVLFPGAVLPPWATLAPMILPSLFFIRAWRRGNFRRIGVWRSNN